MNHRFPVADAHCDFLYYMVADDFDMHHPKPSQMISTENLRKGRVKLQFYAAWIDPHIRVSPLQQALNMIDAYDCMLKACDELVPFTASFEPGCNQIATVLTIEGGEAIHARLENLRLFYKLGVRAMTLTWNVANELAYPAMKKGNKGLTQLGKSVVREMSRIGMAVDVSHLNDAGIDDVLKTATLPVFASHSNARSVFNHKRSLQDEHIKAIADMGGVVCVNYYPPQLTANAAANSQDIAMHIEHIASVGGIDAVGLGSDFDGMTELPVDIESPANVQRIFEALAERGFTTGDIEKIAYQNLRNYIVQFYE